MSTPVMLRNGQVLISASALATCLGMDESSAMNTVKRGLHRNHAGESEYYQSIQDDQDARRRWIIYNSLPHKTKIRVDHYYGDPRKLAARRYLMDRAAKSIEATDFDTARDLGCTIRKAEQVARSAGWCRAVENWDWNSVFSRKLDAFAVAAELITEQNLYGLKCGNPRSLIRKLKQWQKEGFKAIVPRSIGNKHAAIHQETRIWQEEFLAFQYGSPLKPTIPQVARLYNVEAAKRQLKPLSNERIRQILQRPTVRGLWIERRDGKVAARNILETHVNTRRASRPDLMWGIDGTTVQLYSAEGKKLLKPWYMVIVTDAATDAIIGLAIDKTEVAQVVLSAMYDAVKYGGFVPEFVQYDGGAANRGKEVQEALKRMESHGMQGQPYNGKGRHTERLIGRLEQGFLRNMPNFVGGNITGRSKQAKANPDHLALLCKEGELPTPEAIKAQLLTAITVYNHTKAAKAKACPRDLYRAHHADRRVLAEHVRADLFWSLRPGLYEYNARGITMEVRKRRYHFEVESAPGIQDYDFFRENEGTRFAVRYDPTAEEQTCIHLFDRDTGAWVTKAVRKHQFAQVPSDMADGEMGKLHERLDDRKNITEEYREKAAEIEEKFSQAGIPEASFIHLHKDAYNAAQANAELDLIAAQTAFENTTQSPPSNSPDSTSLSPIEINDDDVMRVLNGEDINPL